jgi:hypothetical protein|tara:strand:+ start:438 stop:626 length:189 start_codon:yes stop_codon:yes gene_type:complete
MMNLENWIDESYDEEVDNDKRFYNMILDEIEEVSDCCGADVYEDYDICSNCNDHCGREESEQ